MATKIIDERVVNRGSFFRRKKVQLDHDLTELTARELLCALIVENAGGIYVGLQEAEVPGQEALCIFNTHWHATLALPVLDLSTHAVHEKLAKAHRDFGLTCCQ